MSGLGFLFCNCCHGGCDCGCVEDCRLTNHRAALTAAVDAPDASQEGAEGLAGGEVGSPDAGGLAEGAESPVCECWWTDPSTWLSAASCGYGSGYEPGSQMEWNPDCLAHPPTTTDRPDEGERE